MNERTTGCERKRDTKSERKRETGKSGRESETRGGCSVVMGVAIEPSKHCKSIS